MGSLKAVAEPAGNQDRRCLGWGRPEVPPCAGMGLSASSLRGGSAADVSWCVTTSRESSGMTFPRQGTSIAQILFGLGGSDGISNASRPFQTLLPVWLCCELEEGGVATKVSALNLSAGADVGVGRGCWFVWGRAREKVAFWGAEVAAVKAFRTARRPAQGLWWC